MTSPIAMYVTCVPFDPAPPLSTVSRDERRALVGVLCALAKKHHDAGCGLSVWRIAASYYQLMRLGVAQLERTDAGFFLRLAPNMKTEWVS